MTFQGETVIGQPTLALIEVYAANKGLFCDAQECLDYWNKKKWLTNKGKEVPTLECAVNVYNSIAVQKAVKRNAKKLGYTKLKRGEKKAAEKTIRKALMSGAKRLEDFYVEESEVPKPETKAQRIPYDEQLHDKRWAAFRKFVFAVRGNKCEKCGSTNTIQVHHHKYKTGHLAWEYTCNDVMVLCRKCHSEAHGLRKHKILRQKFGRSR